MVKQNMAAEADPLAGGKEMTTQQCSFGKVGDFIKGTYTNKKVVDTQRGKNVLYELKVIIGTYHEIDPETKKGVDPAKEVVAGGFYTVWGGKQAIDDLFARSKLGDIVALQFKDSVPSKTKGNSPFKIFKTLTFGRDPEYFGQDSTSELEETANEVFSKE